MLGDTLRRMGDCTMGDFRLRVTARCHWTLDAILLSADGLHSIDAARDPAGPAQGPRPDLATGYLEWLAVSVFQWQAHAASGIVSGALEVTAR